MRNYYTTRFKIFAKFFFFNLHKHDIRTDLFYAGKGNHIFTICPEKSAYFPRSGYYDRLDFSCTYVDLHICDTAETPSAAYIDHFFFLQFTDPHTASPPFYALLNLLYERTVPPCTKPQSISLSFSSLCDTITSVKQIKIYLYKMKGFHT